MKKRIISFATGLALMSSIITPIASLADEETTAVFSYETYSVSYEIKSSWDNNQIIEVTLTNTGDEPILNWALQYDTHGQVNGIWNGVIFDSNESSYVIKNSGYNYEILPEDSVTFGYTLTGDNYDVPESISLCSQREDVDAESYSVSLSVSDDWGSGFNGLITIENLSDIPIEAWRLGFDANFEISSVWNAQLLSSDNNSYSVCSDITTTPIGVGETKTFGFAAVKDQDSIPEITNTSLSEVAINADLTDHNDDSSEIDDSSSEYSDDSSSENDDSSETDSSDVSSESDSSDESSEYEEPVVRPQTYTYSVRNEDCAVDEITVSMETAEDLEETTTIESIMDKDIMCSGVVGLFGEPFDIETSAEFSSAVLTFKVDQSMLGDTEFDNLLFLWYDEENENFVELDTEHDEENSTVSTTVTHFSKYMVVDGMAWYTNWQNIYDMLVENGAITPTNVSNQPRIAYGYPAIYGERTSDPVTVNEDNSIDCKRIDVFRQIYNSLSYNQPYELFFAQLCFDGSIGLQRVSNYDLEINNQADLYLKNLNYDLWVDSPLFYLDGLVLGLTVNNFDYYFDISILVVSDDYYHDGQIETFDITMGGTKLFILDLRDGFDTDLMSYATMTGGEYLKYSEENIEYLKQLVAGGEQHKTDTDEDGIPDVFEINGIPLCNGQLIYGCDPESKHSDDDNIEDGEEINPELQFCPYNIEFNGKQHFVEGYFFPMNSDPTNVDTDYDGYWDNVEVNKYNTDPRVNDLELIELKNEYVLINDGTGTTAYGGNQNWFDNYEGYELIVKYGCGLIAMADVCLYLANKDSMFSSYLTDVIYDNMISFNGIISKESYIYYIKQFNDIYVNLSILFEIDGHTINNIDWSMPDMINNYFETNIIPLKAERGIIENSFFETHVREKRIQELLQNDIPAIIAVGPSDDTDGIKLYKYSESLSNKIKEPCYEQTRHRACEHYLVVTGIIIDNIKKDNYNAEAVIYRVSSWGEEYYMYESDYMDYISFFNFELMRNSIFNNVLIITEE